MLLELVTVQIKSFHLFKCRVFLIVCISPYPDLLFHTLKKEYDKKMLSLNFPFSCNSIEKSFTWLEVFLPL